MLIILITLIDKLIIHQKAVWFLAVLVASVHGEAEAEAEADAEAAHYGPHHHGKRPLLVQPIPEAKPICHIEYEVVTKTHCEVEHRQGRIRLILFLDDRYYHRRNPDFVNFPKMYIF